MKFTPAETKEAKRLALHYWPGCDPRDRTRRARDTVIGRKLIADIEQAVAFQSLSGLATALKELTTLLLPDPEEHVDGR